MDNNKDYSEILCTAIDEIVTARLQGLQYDITKMCTVIDDSQARQGKYVVSDGTAKFEAYSTDINYKNGNNVLVVIPNGDYTMQKTISGRISTADTTPFNYTSPMDTMIKITNNVFDGNNTEAGLLANENNQATRSECIYSSDNAHGFAGFTRMGITADFRSWLNGLDVVRGQYGIKVYIYADGLETPGVPAKDQVYELTMSSADMIGNPYQFESYFSQEKVFDISNISKINKLEVYFYQNGQFYDGNDNYIPWQTEGLGELGPQNIANNLFVKNVKVFFGYDYGTFTDETLMLYSEDALTYHYERKDETKTVYLRWVHKIDDYNFEMLDGKYLPENFEVRWFRFNPGYDIVDQYAGKDWEQISAEADDQFVMTFKPDIKKQTEQIKAIGIIKSETGNQFYVSNLLIFENEEQVPSELEVDIAQALQIVCLDNSEGNYFLYDQNGNIMNQGIGQGYNRIVEARFNGAAISESLGYIDYFEWWFPVDGGNNDNYSMIYVDTTGFEAEVQQYQGVEYYRKRLTETDPVTKELNTKQLYSIKNYYSLSNSLNTIHCVISINGNYYHADKELLFGKAGTNGTSTTFVLNIRDNKDAVTINNGQIVIEPHLYDANNSRIDFTEAQLEGLTYSWYKSSNPGYMAHGTKMFDGSITISCSAKSVPKDNYHILKATYQPADGYTLEAYLPIAIKASDEYGFFEGAKSVIYDHQGKPKYYPHQYAVRKYNNETYELVNGKWGISQDEIYDKGKISESYLPSLKQYIKASANKPAQYALQASKFYTKGYNDKVCVYCEGCWSQPILILQSEYDMAILNNWNGNLTIDEENGTILSTMLAAGKKNTDNTFSGVLVGDIQGGTQLNDTATETGVYGMDHGKISYQLKESGKAIFGTAGNGQIEIDGKNGTIQSANFKNNARGMKIDLNTGRFETRANVNNSKAAIEIYPNPDENDGEGYFKIKSTANNTLMHIGSKEYYLQTDNYNKDNRQQGVKFDLTNSNLEVKSPYGRIKLSGQGSASEPFFQIAVPSKTVAEVDADYNNILFNSGKDSYYMKSRTYSGITPVTATYKNNTYYVYKATAATAQAGSDTSKNGINNATSNGDTIYLRTSGSDYIIYNQSKSYKQITFKDIIQYDGGEETIVWSKEEQLEELIGACLYLDSKYNISNKNYLLYQVSSNINSLKEKYNEFNSPVPYNLNLGDYVGFTEDFLAAIILNITGSSSTLNLSDIVLSETYYTIKKQEEDFLQVLIDTGNFQSINNNIYSIYYISESANNFFSEVFNITGMAYDIPQSKLIGINNNKFYEIVAKKNNSSFIFQDKIYTTTDYNEETGEEIITEHIISSELYKNNFYNSLQLITYKNININNINYKLYNITAESLSIYEDWLNMIEEQDKINLKTNLYILIQDNDSFNTFNMVDLSIGINYLFKETLLSQEIWSAADQKLEFISTLLNFNLSNWEYNNTSYNLYAITSAGLDVIERINSYRTNNLIVLKLNEIVGLNNSSDALIKVLINKQNEIVLTNVSKTNNYTTWASSDQQNFYVGTLEAQINETPGTQAGFKLDFESGSIQGYNLLLRGTKVNEPNKFFILDSGASTTPFNISNNFKVSWDGQLRCNKVVTLNNDNNDNYPISINDNFQINSSGQASGSGVSFSGGFSGSGNFSSGNFTGGGTAKFQTGNFANLTADKATIKDLDATTLKVGGQSLKLQTITYLGNLTVSGKTRKFVTSVDTYVSWKNGIPDVVSEAPTQSGLYSVTVKAKKFSIDIFGPEPRRATYPDAGGTYP